MENIRRFYLTTNLIYDQPATANNIQTKEAFCKNRHDTHGGLGFLLITFFIFTTSLMQPSITKLFMPKESTIAMPVNKKHLLTALLDKDKVYVYEGAFEEAVAANRLIKTNYSV